MIEDYHVHVCPSCNSNWDCYDLDCPYDEEGDAICPDCEAEYMEDDDDFDEFRYDVPPYEDEDEE